MRRNGETTPSGENSDPAVIAGFGDEWSRFDQSGANPTELEQVFAAYFSNFPWVDLPAHAVGFDMGCGTGRWAKFVAPRVGVLHCIDPARPALAAAERNLRGLPNCILHEGGVDDIPMADASADFGYCLGVLHHIPDTQAGLNACVAKLKRGAPFLIYLYYAFDNRPRWFRVLWHLSNHLRRVISRSPFRARYAASQAIALAVYWPLARIARLLERAGVSVESFPLSFYRNHGLYVMRTDALDRFGTRLEKRFTRREILAMMRQAGLISVTFNEHPPYWTALGTKA